MAEVQQQADPAAGRLEVVQVELRFLETVQSCRSEDDGECPAENLLREAMPEFTVGLDEVSQDPIGQVRMRQILSS